MLWRAGDFVLRERPAALVLESAMSHEFGARTGNELRRDDAHSGRPDMIMFRMLFAVAGKLSEVTHPEKSEHWQEVKARMYGEQLAAIAGLTVDARLVYGDRPKDVTYRRLAALCDAAALDASFGRRSTRNLQEALGWPPQQDVADVRCPVERVMMLEREAVLCHSGCAAGEAAPSGRSVVLLVGACATVWGAQSRARVATGV